MDYNIKFFVYIIFGLFAITSFWLLISSTLDHQNKLTPAERKKIKLEKQKKLKQEYEEKKRVKKEQKERLEQEKKELKNKTKYKEKNSIFSFLKSNKNSKKNNNNHNNKTESTPIKNDYVQENDILDKLNNLTEKLKDI